MCAFREEAFMKRAIRVVGIVAAAAMVMAACGSSSSDYKAQDTPTTGRSTTTATTAANGSGAPLSADLTVRVAATTKYGEVLVGPNGHTLYLFEEDQDLASACTGGCATVWPALTASGTPSADTAVASSKLKTADGQAPNQVAYNGHLLYYYAGDTAEGDVNGTAIPSWYPVNPAGDKVDRD